MKASKNTGKMVTQNDQISDKEFKLMKDLIYLNFGINLGEHKRSMIPGRLQSILRKLGMNSFQEYYEYVIADNSGQALIELVNHISTNYTFFYREKEHFDYLYNNILPDLILNLKHHDTKDIRIWSAGCSSGEEPYMLVILLMEQLGNDRANWDLTTLATDISDKVLNLAKIGIYPEERLSLLPTDLKKKYFKMTKNGQFQIIDEVKRNVVFRRLNLMNNTFPFKKKFHCIFCRNVMIYFDQKTRNALVNRYYNNLLSGGYLFIGHSETLGKDNEQFKYIMPALYRKIN